MDRPKTLPPTMRDRKRYIAFEVVSEKPIDFPDVVNEMWASLLSLLGELGTSKANVWFVKDAWSQDRQIGLVRCEHNSTEQVRAAIGLITEISGKRVIVHSLGISGTMKGARSKFFGETSPPKSSV